jgi:hypothetical protein
MILFTNTVDPNDSTYVYTLFLYPSLMSIMFKPVHSRIINTTDTLLIFHVEISFKRMSGTT